VKVYLALILFVGYAFAQPFSFGVKGGVPLTDAFSASQGSPTSYSSVTRRYTVGPTAEIGVPLFGLSVEADGLYRRIGWNSNRAATALYEPYQSTARMGAWDFDALLKHRIGGPGVHAYLGAGAAFSRLFTTRENYTFPGPPPGDLSKQMVDEVQSKNIGGIVVSAGVKFGGAIRVAPELRYTRWLSNNIIGGLPNLSTQVNQVEVLVSITFGRP
jgi:hypothetical protein